MLYQSSTLEITELNDGLAELCLDNKNAPINVFDAQTIGHLSEALEVLEGHSDLKGLLISSAKKDFVVGADVSHLERARSEGPEATAAFVGSNISNFNRLEDLPFPVVVAINGAALGGGYEICLAADVRVTSTKALVGCPESTLGIFPGWGATVRLPRLIGLQKAAEWIVSGSTYKAEIGYEAGAAEALVEPEELRSKALDLLNQCVSGELDYKAKRANKKAPLNIPSEKVSAELEALKDELCHSKVDAVRLAVESMEQSALLEREQALAVESDFAAQAVASDAAGAMLGNFVSDQKLGHLSRNWAKQSSKPVTKAAVLGAGIMGGGISYVSALKGIDTQMKDIVQVGLDAGMKEADSLLSRRVKRGRLTEEKKAEILGRIHPKLEYGSDFGELDIVVEAVIENPKIKQAVLSEVEGKVGADTVIASNTSTISITHLAEPLERPENFCGMHFFNPVHAMPLVEVIRGEKTSDEAVARTVAYAVALGKKPVVVNDCPGFLVNRSLFPYFFGFSMLLRDGANFQQVDHVMQNWGWPMGPAYLADVIGIDTLDHCEHVMAEGFPDRMTKSSPYCIDILAAAELYGQKNGAGFYNYTKDENGRPQKLASGQAYELLEPHCAERREFSEEEIIARMMIPMATEMSRILQDKIVSNAFEADLGLLYGLGFPGFRGGVMRWMDAVGLDRICEMADQYASLGKLYEPTESMRNLSAQGKGFYSS